MALRVNVAKKILLWTLRAFAALIVFAVPATGVWVGSSLAAYLNGPVWLVCLAGLLLFPVLPVAWAVWSRRRRAVDPERQVLTLWDQILVRTFVLNGLFVGGLLWMAPQAAFTAVSSRGDWMLEGLDSDAAGKARAWIHDTADGFDWLYDSHDNEYADLVDDDSDVRPDPVPSSAEEDPWADPFHKPEPEPESEPEPDAPEAKPEPGSWPQPAILHPALGSMPTDAKTSVASVGQWISDHESDPYERVKLIHDFVADHVAYDAPALADGRRPPQDADTVLATGVGVCAGYANLTRALGAVTGDEIVTVVGDSRGQGGEISGGGHAWNAVRIEGAWYLMDTTWDAGHVNGRTFTKRYSTGYLFVPPGIMGVTHFPEDPVWQLRAEPLSRGAFVRQPMMRPEFFAAGLTLVSPDRSQVTIDDSVDIALTNGRGLFMLASYTSQSGGTSRDCEVDNGPQPRIHCDFAGEGTYHIRLFAAAERYGTYPMVGEIQVNATG